MDDLYRDFILEHYKRPRNFGELDSPDHEAHEVNPLCGDELGVQIAVDETAASPTCASRATAARSRRPPRRSPPRS